MLDACEEFWEEAGLEDQLHLERFSLDLGDSAPRAASITFANSGKQVEVDGATTLLEAGEKAGVEMPYGCRMGICHTCDVPLASGRIRDLRNGEEHDEPNEYIQTCVTAACGDVHPEHLTHHRQRRQPHGHLGRQGVHPPHRRARSRRSAASSTRSARRSRSRAAPDDAATSPR